MSLPFISPYLITTLPSLSTEKVVTAVPAGFWESLRIWQDWQKGKKIKVQMNQWIKNKFPNFIVVAL